MVLKLPIMLWSNVSEFYLLCLIYAPHAKHYPRQIQHFIFLILLKLKIMSISSLLGFSTVQHTINNSSTHVYEYFEFIFVAFVIHILTRKSLPQIHPNLKILWNVQLAIVAYYAGIMLNALAFPLCSIFYWHNMLKPNGDVCLKRNYRTTE